jgi:hypothetical protein
MTNTATIVIEPKSLISTAMLGQSSLQYSTNNDFRRLFGTKSRCLDSLLYLLTWNSRFLYEDCTATRFHL